MKQFFLILLGLTAILGAIAPAQAREQIRIVGSATVYPFVTAAAEQFGLGEKFRTPIVENTGTGGGFKLFCDGVGENTPDVTNASRLILDSESANCKKKAVTALQIPIGYDGIVLAAKRGTPPFSVTKKHLFMALARELPDGNGGWKKNSFQRWKEIDTTLPDRDIVIYGPPPTSGTRDAFGELTMEIGCETFAEFHTRFADAKERKKNCKLLREDGKYIETSDDGNVMVQKLVSNDRALGILGFSFFDENVSQLQSAAIESVHPNVETISSGSYGMARGLYIYVKKEHIGVIPGIVEFLQELTSENAVGEEGYITAKGLLPLPLEQRAQVRQTLKSLKEGK